MARHLTILLPNVPGALYDVAQALSENDVNIWTHHLANLGRSGFVQLICDPHDAAYRVLKSKYKYYVTESEVLAIKVDNKPGSLVRVLRLLKEADLSIINSYDTFDANGAAITIMELDPSSQLPNAKHLLHANNIEVVEEILTSHDIGR